MKTAGRYYGPSRSFHSFQVIQVDWGWKKEFYRSARTFEPLPDKMTVHPVKTPISLGIHPVWSVVDVHSMGSQGPKLSSCRQWRLITLDGCLRWPKSSLGAQVILFVWSCCGSFVFFANVFSCAGNLRQWWKTEKIQFVAALLHPSSHTWQLSALWNYSKSFALQWHYYCIDLKRFWCTFT